MSTGLGETAGVKFALCVFVSNKPITLTPECSFIQITCNEIIAQVTELYFDSLSL